MNFGSWAIGVRAVPAQYVTLSSGINGIGFTADGSISGPNASDFAILGPTSCTGRPNIQCQLILAFTPSGLGVRTASFVTNFGSIALSGTGLPDGPFFTVTPAPITTAAPSNIVVLNNGSTPLSLSGTVTGVDAGDFVLTNPCLISGSDDTNIPPGVSCNLTVAFTPSQPGLRTATLIVTDATSGLSETTTLQATTATTGDFTISPSPLTFGPTDIGNVSAAQTAIISAPNGHPVTIQGGSSDFLLSTGTTCATQTPCQISVSFKPTAVGQRNATYQVTDIATGESYYLSVTGSGGILTVSLSPASLTFAARDEGTTSIPQTITVTNTGDIYMIATGVVLVGANPGDFSIQSDTCVTAQQNDVAPGDSCSISVSFNPTASGARSATLQIISNSSTSPDTVQLSGTGN
jgi:trimeric autotransporter adhesin